METTSDEDLVARSRLDGLSPDRRRELLDQLFARYHAKVALWCFRVTGDRNSAADMAQDVLLKAYRNLDSWRGQARFSTWLYSIARNHCFNELSARAVRPEGTSNSLDFDPVAPAFAAPDRAVELESEIRQMRKLMKDTLDDTEASVMTLHYGEDLSLDAVTRLLSLTNPSGAKKYVVSAKRKLQAAVLRLRPSGGRKEPRNAS